MQSALSAPHFHNEEAAFEYVEARLWPKGPTCPHCGETVRIGVLKGKTTRPGLRKCYFLPQAIHRPRGHRVRVQPRPAADLASGNLPHVLV
jgi:hypothetical protein